ncbi:MAG: ankyrin repeat domain-containing protein [Alphaproteobacteria bacterium]
MTELYKQLVNSNFLAAAKRGDVAVADAMLKDGARLHVSDHDDKTALHIAAENGQAKMIEFLLSKGAEPKGVDEDGNIPLALALKAGHEAASLALVKAEFNSAAKDKRGFGLLHHAVEFEFVVAALLGKGLAVDDKTEKDETPLHIAAEKNAVGAARRLLAAGANINAQNGSGMTPLIIAVRAENLEMAEFLLKEGADAAKQTHMSLTAADLAHMRKSPEMEALLKRAFEEYDMIQLTEGSRHDVPVMHAIKLKR